VVITDYLDKELHQPLLFTCGLEDTSNPNLMEKKQLPTVAKGLLWNLCLSNCLSAFCFVFVKEDLIQSALPVDLFNTWCWKFKNFDMMVSIHAW